MKKQFKETDWNDLLNNSTYSTFRFEFMEGFEKGVTSFERELERSKMLKEVNPQFDLLKWIREKLVEYKERSVNILASVNNTIKGMELLFFEGGYCTGYIDKAQRFLKFFPKVEKYSPRKLSDIFYFSAKYSEVMESLIARGYCIENGSKILWKSRGGNEVLKIIALYLILINKGYIDLSKIYSTKEVAQLFSNVFNYKFDPKAFKSKEINNNLKLIDLYKLEFSFL